MRPAFLAFLLLIAPAAHAADCDNEATQTGLNRCFGALHDAADKKLNDLYKQATHRLADAPDARALLVASQRSWIKFRDDECAFAASGVEGGSIYPMILAQCLTDLTTARSADLTRYLSCEEGDLGCPVPPE